jgi:sugar porter (SP) family MFS transporter
MPEFLQKFYPSVYVSEQSAVQDNYCKYNNQVFQLYTSSLYLAALLASFVAARLTRKYGHKHSMLWAGLLFLAGTGLGAGAENLEMLIIGRVLLGVGLGFANQAIPLYLSEIAPPSYRGGLNMMFSINIALGIFSGNLVNYLAAHIHPWGWRLSLAMAGVPAISITAAGLFLVESPSHLIARGQHEQAKRVLLKIRGGAAAGADKLSIHAEAEYEGLVKAAKEAELMDQRRAFRNLLKRRNTPQVVMAVALPFFQQFSGNDAILFYGPFLFKAAGLGAQASLYSTVVTGTVAVVGTLISIFIVDRAGRRTILLISSLIMFLCMVGV